MKKSNPGQREDTAADRAITELLKAEAAAERAVLECRDQADRLIQDAQRRAQRIHERVDARITLMHMRCADKVSRKIKQLGKVGNSQQRDEQKLSLDNDRVQAVVDRLAARLSGEDDSSAVHQETAK